MEPRSDDDDAAVDDAAEWEADHDYSNIDALIASINERDAALHAPRRVRIRRAITVRRVVLAAVLVAVAVVAWIYVPVLAAAYTVGVLLCAASAAISRADGDIAVHGLGQARYRVPPEPDRPAVYPASLK